MGARIRRSYSSSVPTICTTGSVTMNCAPSPRSRLGREITVVSFHDAAADREAHAGSRVGASAMQPLKRREDAVEVFLIEADSIVGHGDAGDHF
jgi:hypothetical protein